MNIVLRPDQAALKADVYAGWQSGARNVLAVLPTGGGKSVIVSDIMLDIERTGEVQAVIAHRNELVTQMAMHVAKRGIHHRIIAPREIVADAATEQREELGRSYINPNAKCGVVGVDTLIARQEQLKPWLSQVSRWTIDEAHHVLRQNKWGRAVAMFPNAYGLGVTATPQRADGMGLGAHADGVFNAMYLGPSTRQLIEMSALSKFDLVIDRNSDFRIDDDDIGPNGDFTQEKMRAASERSNIVGDVVIEYIKHAYGKRGITFATDVETANKIAARFNMMGVPAACVHGKTPGGTRREYIRMFKRGELLQLVNVDLFGEGFDVPAVEVVSLARPTASLAVYLQQVGRALRTLSGKLVGIIIDHVSNWLRHKLPDTGRFWTLDRRDKRAKKEKNPEEVPMRGCDNCSRPYEAVKLCCPYCGKVPDPPAARSSIKEVDGELMLLDHATLERMRQAATLETPASIGMRTSIVAGPFAAAGQINRQMERIAEQERLKDAMAWWVGLQRSLGRPDAESERRFYLTTGMSTLEALGLSRPDMGKLADRLGEWMK